MANVGVAIGGPLDGETLESESLTYTHKTKYHFICGEWVAWETLVESVAEIREKLGVADIASAQPAQKD